MPDAMRFAVEDVGSALRTENALARGLDATLRNAAPANAEGLTVDAFVAGDREAWTARADALKAMASGGKTPSSDAFFNAFDAKPKAVLSKVAEYIGTAVDAATGVTSVRCVGGRGHVNLLGGPARVVAGRLVVATKVPVAAVALLDLAHGAALGVFEYAEELLALSVCRRVSVCVSGWVSLGWEWGQW